MILIVVLRHHRGHRHLRSFRGRHGREYLFRSDLVVLGRGLLIYRRNSLGQHTSRFTCQPTSAKEVCSLSVVAFNLEDTMPPQVLHLLHASCFQELRVDPMAVNASSTILLPARSFVGRDHLTAGCRGTPLLLWILFGRSREHGVVRASNVRIHDASSLSRSNW